MSEQEKSDFLKYSSISDVEYITGGDEGDWAQNQQLQEQARTAELARKANKPETHPDFDGESCVECGDIIPKERLLLHKVRCVNCQADLENRKK